MFLNMPRGALPIGVRVAAMMYASCNCLVMLDLL
jgi:predicted phosphoribosyltransferase